MPRQEAVVLHDVAVDPDCAAGGLRAAVAGGHRVVLAVQGRHQPLAHRRADALRVGPQVSRAYERICAYLHISAVYQ